MAQAVVAGAPPRQFDTVERGLDLVLVVIGIMCATLMQTLDTTIVNVALPTIQGNLGASQDEGAWVVTGYIISAVIVIPLTPWLQQRFGRKQYYGIAVIGFTIASMLCGISNSITELILWRVVQGLFGGGLVATAQAALRDSFPPAQLGTSQAVFALGAIVGPSVGPTLGGWLTDNYSWNWVFFINVVPGTVAAIIIFTRLKNPTEPRKLPVDAIGLGLLAMGLGSLQYILDEGQRNDWFSDARIRFFAFTSLAGIVGFAFWSLFGTRNPIVDLHALRFRAIAAGSALSLAIGAVLFGAIVILPQYTQGILGWTATLSGELIFVRAIFIAAFTPFIARTAAAGKIDTRILLFFGFSCVGISQIWLSRLTVTDISFWGLVPQAILGGVGLSMLFTPISIAVQGGVPPEVAPKASAFQSLSLQLGGSFSTAALITLLARRQAFHQTIIAGHTNLSSPAIASLVAGPGAQGKLAQFYALVQQQSLSLSYADCQFALGILTFALMPFILILPPRRKGGGPISAAVD